MVDVAATRTRSLEAAIVVLASVVVVSVTHLPTLRGLSTTVAGDLGDPLYFAWQLAWVQHAVFADPARLWTSPAFLQAPGNLAFTDTMLGYLPLGLFLPEGQAGAVTLLNLAWLAAAVMAIVGSYALARAMGGGPLAAAAAGAGFGFAHWRITQTAHLNVLSVGGIALALAFLARGNGWSLRHGWRPERMSWRWIAGGWAAACYQLTFGWATGIWFAYTLAVAMVLWTVGWWRLGRARPSLPRGVVRAHLLGVAVLIVTAGLLLAPYVRVLIDHPESRRGVGRVLGFSPPPHGLLTAPAENWLWGPYLQGWRASLQWSGEMAMSPGFVVLALALVGLGYSAWPRRRRLGLAAVTAVLAVLSTGTAFPVGHGLFTYLPLAYAAPGWSALRTPGRLMIWVTLGLCLLAAGAVARFEDAARRRRSGMLAVVGLLPAVLVVVDGLSTMPVKDVPGAPVALRTLADPILLLPTDPVSDYGLMLWQTDGWPVLANGSSGFDPRAQTELRAAAATFPDAASVAALRVRGIRTVVLDRSRTAGTAWARAADRSVDLPGVVRVESGDAVVYDLGPGTAVAR
jgi:hypothetical protein